MSFVLAQILLAGSVTTNCVCTLTLPWEGANDYEEIAKEEKLSELQLRIRQLIDQSKMIQKEQAYQRAREARFRETSESTNARVLWWSIVQTAILVVTGYWQIRHLRGFFEAKKLV
eukprot:Opistho-2@2775